MKIDFEIIKTLSPTDTGENGCHQAGILIPKDNEILEFFPRLDKESKNPRKTMEFIEKKGKVWNLNFIYYNNKLFGGTRDEYRLTGITGYMREYELKSGDELIFTKSPSGLNQISYRKNLRVQEIKNENEKILKLGNKWRVISF